MKHVLFAVAMAVSLAAAIPASGAVRVPETARNLLVDAKVFGNLESFNKGLRGELRDMIFDHQQGAFVRPSR